MIPQTCFATLPCLSLILWLSTSLTPAQGQSVDFRKIVLNEHFHSEGADFGDLNQDGHADVISGPFWYAGPDFKTVNRYASGERFSTQGYSQHFFSFAEDVDQDGCLDIVAIGMPGQPARWYRNPGNSIATSTTSLTGTASTAEHKPPRMWDQFTILDDVGGESPMLLDFDQDGQRDLICVHGGQFGYASRNNDRPESTWSFQAISEPAGLGMFTHGMGVGDVDRDGNWDLLETRGWYAMNESDGSAVRHAFRFAKSGGAQMFAYDFDGDGDNDIVSVQNAHAYGLTWFERRGSTSDELWIPHEILPEQPQRSSPLNLSQMHALALEDIDGDGIKDLVTGKRYYAHGGKDPGAQELPVLYWFRTVRTSSGVTFEPHLIDVRVGVGTQLTTGDINQDGRPDILVANKLGTFVLLSEIAGGKPSKVHENAAGQSDFALGVRESQPLTPAAERESFVLPDGFTVELVAAEPDIAKPLNMAFDASGRLWVTCTLEYPDAKPLGEAGRDSIKVLSDFDPSGRAQSVVTFADGLNIPIGLYPYGDGVICYSIAEILYLRDTDHDGICDRREKLYGPFDHTRDTHGMCNGFLRGLDGWLYSCHGFNNQSEVAGSDGMQIRMQSGNTFRMALDGTHLDHITHGQVNPFGLGLDRRGDLFSADCHTKPVSLLLRGGYYPSFGKPHDGVGFVPEVMQHLHGSTAIAGIALTGDMPSWPAAYRDNAFGGNVMTSRVNRNSLLYQGGSVRAQEEPDLLISGDAWFRPVDLKLGPDGALYVADFYNRIIGHYEVPLDHPGRDRTRGRIWRIKPRNAPEHAVPDLSQMSGPELIERLGSKNASIRGLALDQLSDRMGADGIPSLLASLSFETANEPEAQRQSHVLWALYRLKAVDQAMLLAASKSKQPLLRAHAMRVLGAMLDDQSRGETTSLDDLPLTDLADLVWAALHDQDPLVQRNAAMVLTRHVMEGSVTDLLNAWKTVPSSDPHTRHALRMALRHQLRAESTFKDSIQDLPPDQTLLIASIALALPHSAAADFLVDALPLLASHESAPDLLEDTLKHAARFSSHDALPELIELSRQTLALDEDTQLAVLASIQAGIEAESRPIPKALRTWTTELAHELLALNDDLQSLPWQAVGLDTPQSDSNSLASDSTWRISNARNSSDGEHGSRLWSSFPAGEKRVGVLRSPQFAMPEQFEFYLAGHDGFPQDPRGGKNLVRLVDGTTQNVLWTWQVPRNDEAQLRSVTKNDLPQVPQTSVYLELVDGDSANAYAWLAAGRFSVPQLNPSLQIDRRRKGLKLVRETKLSEILPELRQWVRGQMPQGSHSSYETLQTIAHLSSNPTANSLVAVASIQSLRPDLRNAIVEQVLAESVTLEQSRASIEQALVYASPSEQMRVVEALSGNSRNLELLIDLWNQGKASTAMLADTRKLEQLLAIANESQRQSIEQLTESLPAEEAGTNDLILGRLQSFSRGPRNSEAGKRLFQNNCANCHQLAGKGQAVGPNLDGIGNRGLARLMEDVLAPNRNVDSAFRSTTIVTVDGKVHSGLARESNDDDFRLIEPTGREIRVPKSEIEIQKQSRLSPMPANFGQVLSEAQMHDLMNYLLLQR